MAAGVSRSSVSGARGRAAVEHGSLRDGERTKLAGDPGVTDTSGDSLRVDEMQRRFRRIEIPRPFAEYGHAHAVALEECPAEECGADVEVCRIDVPRTLGRAVPRRVRSYLAGRHCAARAISAFLPDFPHRREALATGQHGSPVWPPAVVGSITHSTRLAAAVVAPMERWRGLGVDCERVMTAEVADEIVSRIIPELETIRRAGVPIHTMPWPLFVTAVFSAKESIYKCLSPITGTFFDFDAVQLEALDAGDGTLQLRLVQTLSAEVSSGMLLHVRFCVDQEHVFTAVGLPAA